MADTALVTGGKWHVALEIIRQLLVDGDTVHATVRSLSNVAKTRPLTQLQEQFPGRLHLFEANLVSPGSFDAAMQGCTLVYHVAASFLLPEQIKDRHQQLIEPAISGRPTFSKRSIDPRASSVLS